MISVNHVTGERRVVLDPAPAGPQTEAAMRDLIVWYTQFPSESGYRFDFARRRPPTRRAIYPESCGFWVYNQAIREHPWPLLVATEFVFRFLAIHPFQDGNGRLGRALFLLGLLQADEPALSQLVRFISIDRQIERHRPLYYSVLHQVSGGRFRNDPALYALEPLAWFLVRMLESALADVAVLRRRFAALQRLSESAVKVLGCFKSAPERRLQVADRMVETGLVRRTVQNALGSLSEAGLLQRLGAGPGTRYQLIS